MDLVSQYLAGLFLNSANTPEINVKSYGAVGNGIADDTAAIQSAFNAGGNIFIPDGIYLIDAETKLGPQSNTRIRLSPGATLKAKGNSTSNTTAVIRIINAHDIVITGGHIRGERYEHVGTAGESGMGIILDAYSHDIYIGNMTISDCWGDGIYVGTASTYTPPTNIFIDRVICDNNRRQGMSLVFSNGVIATNSKFQNSNGTDPQCGVDIEPNSGCTCNNAMFINCEFNGNVKHGLLVSSGVAYSSNIFMYNCLCNGNGVHGLSLNAFNGGVFQNISTKNNGKHGISIDRDVQNVTFSKIASALNMGNGLGLWPNSQAIGVENLSFTDCDFENNNQAKLRYSGAIIGFTDPAYYMRNVSFLRCRFCDDQNTPTQYYGVSYEKNALITNLTFTDCTYGGNVYGDTDDLIVMDHFDRADNNTGLGNAVTGQAWVQSKGVMGISGNQAKVISQDGNGVTYAYIETGRSDVRVSCIMGTTGDYKQILVFRDVDYSNKLSVYYLSGQYLLRKTVGGTTSTIQAVTMAQASYDKITVEAVGNSIKVYINDALIITATDAFNQTATKHGIAAISTLTSIFNNFKIQGLHL